MSWQLAAFAILALALTGGFWWYERTRPDARIVALVGTLAAFAALGRIAFAAVPNVKPTSDIVLISGYALGGGPGFAVGAIAGLASNFFFGQGPWTPWQMAAWGITGVVGAGLALICRGRPIGRWPLAIACCVCGFAFTAVQDAGDWVTYSDHSVAQLGVYVGQGLGFDAIYAGSCLVFALAFGPALLRSIQRFTKRLEITWLAPGSSVAPLLAIAVVLVGSAAVAGGVRTPAARAATDVLQGPVDYLLHAQNADGGFGAQAGQPSSSLFAGWAALGLESAGVRLESVDRGAGADRLRRAHGRCCGRGFDRAQHPRRPRGWTERVRFRWARPAGDAPRQVRARRLGRRRRQPDRRSGSWRCARPRCPCRRGPTRGCWPSRTTTAASGSHGAGGASDVDDTGSVLEAVASLPGSRAAAVRAAAIAYVRRQQDRDGGFPSQPGEGSNAQSTAWAIQGLDAAGVNPAGVHRAGGPSPLAYLESLIGPDGAVAYARGQVQTPVWVTGEALMALAGKPLPLAPLSAPAAKPSRTPKSPAPVTPAPTSTTRSDDVDDVAGGSARRSRHGRGPRRARLARRARGGWVRPRAGAAGRGAASHGGPAGHRSPGQGIDSPANAPAGDGRGESAVVEAVVETATRTVAGLRALM